MKNKMKYISLLLLLVTSCNYDSINVDPNQVTVDKVDPKYLLPTLQYDLASAYGGNIAYRVGNTVNQVIYKFGPTQLNTYIYTPADGTGTSIWNSLYAAMNSAYIINKKVDKAGTGTYYRGISKILMASALGTVSSIYGDVPFSEAFEYGLYPNPAFDPQESVYNSIQTLLDEGIKDMDVAAVGLAPSTEDLIYKGSSTKWVRAAHALKARYYLHLIKKNPGVYALAEAELALAFTSNDDNCVLRFMEGNISQQHPLYNERTATRNTEVDINFALLLFNAGDPRTNFYTTIPPTIDMDVANYGPFYGMQDSYCPIITYEECLFMKAEIEMNKNNASIASSTLRNAIYNSLKRVCSKTVGKNDNTEANEAVAIPDGDLQAYANAQSDFGTLTTDQIWNKIFQEKYIALFLQTQVWADYRRSTKYVAGVDGLPILTPRSGTTIPKRYNYPNTEVAVRIKNKPPEYTIFDKVWWEQ